MPQAGPAALGVANGASPITTVSWKEIGRIRSCIGGGVSYNQQKTDCFVEQKVLNPEKWKKKQSASRAEQVDEKADESTNYDLYDSITEDMFILQQMQLKKCENYEEGQALWKEVLADDLFSKEWHQASQQWLLKQFRGVRNATGTRQSKLNRLVNNKDIDDMEDMKQAEDLLKMSAAQAAAWLKRMKAHVSAGAHSNSDECSRVGEHDMDVVLPTPFCLLEF